MNILMDGRSKFHWELYNLIKECDVHELALRFNCSIINEIVVDSFLFDLKNTCCKLKLDRPAQITTAGIHSIYTSIVERSSKMYSIDLGISDEPFLQEFLLMVGIRFENGNLFSARDIETYDFEDFFKAEEEGEEDVTIIHKHVFVGNLQMKFGKRSHEWLSLKYH
ncbi:hypothetical protein PRIPAC_72187, partial [Pristionchus pacificus]